MVHQPDGLPHAGRKVLVKWEGPGERGMRWEPSPLLLLLAPGEFPWGAKPFSLGKAVAGAPGDAELLLSEWNLDALGKALLAPTWRWRTSAGTNHSEDSDCPGQL